MNTKDVLAEMEKVSDERTKKIWASHGATGSFFGVKVEDMKKIQKKVKINQQTIAMELFDSGIGDARCGWSKTLNSDYDQLVDLFKNLASKA